jgi:hypothetical protein
MNGKRFLWSATIFLGFLLVFSQVGMAQMGSGPSAADPNYRFKFIGAEVFNPQGEYLGKVVDVSLSDLNAAQNMSSFIIVAPNISELKGRYVAIPFTVPQDYRSSELILVITRDELAHAPNFSKEQWPMGVNSWWATDSYRYFGQTPYFSG